MGSCGFRSAEWELCRGLCGHFQAVVTQPHRHTTSAKSQLPHKTTSHQPAVTAANHNKPQPTTIARTLFWSFSSISLATLEQRSHYLSAVAHHGIGFFQITSPAPYCRSGYRNEKHYYRNMIMRQRGRKDVTKRSGALQRRRHPLSQSCSGGR